MVNKTPTPVKSTAVNIEYEVYTTFRLREPKTNLSKLVTDMLKVRNTIKLETKSD
jgi:hypothetical protein